MNERLRAALQQHGIEPSQLAQACGVDPKTVERWITISRVPHRRHRWAAAARLETDESYLWPAVAPPSRRENATSRELVAIYPDRASVPRETLLRLLSEAQERIDVLVFSGTFFAQTQPRVATMLGARMATGVKVRLCFGNPAGDAVAIRDREERLGGTLSAKIRASLTYYIDLADAPGCEIRLHDCTLYASIFRYDDEILANPHVYGEPASLNPTFHFRRNDDGTLFDHYANSFQRVWDTALPWLGTGI